MRPRSPQWCLLAAVIVSAAAGCGGSGSNATLAGSANSLQDTSVSSAAQAADESVGTSATIDTETSLAASPGASPTTSDAVVGSPTTAADPTAQPANPPATVASPTTPAAAPVTTTAPSLTLRTDGIGGQSFGARVADVLAAVSALGVPTSDDPIILPNASDVGFENEDGDFFVAPLARTVCFAEPLCLVFGGTTNEDLTFRGWTYRGETLGTIFNASRVTIGQLWSEVADRITVVPGGCYTIGSGTTSDGILLTLQGDSFSSFDDDGGYVASLPPPEETRIVGMAAGEEVGYLFGDC